MTTDDYLLMRDGYTAEIQRLEKLLATFTRNRKYKTIVDRERAEKRQSQYKSMLWECRQAEHEINQILQKTGWVNDKF